MSSLFHVTFAIDQLGTFSATYLLDVSDTARVSGGTADALTLNVFGTVVVPEPGSISLAAAALFALVGVDPALEPASCFCLGGGR